MGRALLFLDSVYTRIVVIYNGYDIENNPHLAVDLSEFVVLD